MQKIGSFLKWLWSIISGGIHVGDKNEDKSTHDSAPKQSVSGLKSSANMTIGTNNSYSYQGQQNTNSGEGMQFVINSPCELKVSTTSNTASPRPLPPLSEQAKSIMKQLVKSGHAGLVAELKGALIEGLITKENQRITLDNIDSVEDDLNCLVANKYLTEPQKCSSGYGCIYDLTMKGKKFGKSLLAE